MKYISSECPRPSCTTTTRPVVAWGKRPRALETLALEPYCFQFGCLPRNTQRHPSLGIARHLAARAQASVRPVLTARLQSDNPALSCLGYRELPLRACLSKNPVAIGPCREPSAILCRS